MTNPNVVFILSDDLSWGDLGCYGQDKIETPHMDALAMNGMRFTACYAGAPVCAPSRSTLMQGRHLGHATVRENMVFDGDNVYRHCLQADDVTVAQIFKGAGYATGMFGKWGLALRDQTGLPNDMGFDEFYGYLNQRKAHSYYPPYLWHNKEKVELPQNCGHNHREPNEYDANGDIIVNGVEDPRAASFSFDLCEEKSLDFVKANKDNPFFLYLPVTIPHGTHEVPNLLQYKDKDWPLHQKVYAAMVTHFDNSVGRLVATLKELGVFDDTLIIFASDNGYSHGGQGRDGISLAEFFDHTGPYKGQKGNLNQGGVRVPAFAHWTGKVPAGTVSDTPWGFFDFLPTACELLDQPLPDDVDGISILPAWTDHAAKPERDFMYWEFGQEQAARIDDYFVHRGRPEEPIEVFHADNDPAQEHDLSAELPELVEKAKAIFDREHRPSLYYPSPGESDESWKSRMQAAGVSLVDNANG